MHGDFKKRGIVVVACVCVHVGVGDSGRTLLEKVAFLIYYNRNFDIHGYFVKTTLQT